MGYSCQSCCQSCRQNCLCQAFSVARILNRAMLSFWSEKSLEGRLVKWKVDGMEEMRGRCFKLSQIVGMGCGRGKRTGNLYDNKVLRCIGRNIGAPTGTATWSPAYPADTKPPNKNGLVRSSAPNKFAPPLIM